MFGKHHGHIHSGTRGFNGLGSSKGINEPVHLIFLSRIFCESSCRLLLKKMVVLQVRCARYSALMKKIR